MNPNETAPQYISRILSNLGEQDPRPVLASTASRLRDLVAGRSSADLARRPGPDKWSATEILAHLADAELVASWRMRSILASDGVAIQAFDQDAWAGAFRYADADPLESLTLFEITRRANLSLLDRVDPALHANHGMHAERGKETVTHLLRLYAGHDLNHLVQVERLMRA